MAMISAWIAASLAQRFIDRPLTPLRGAGDEEATAVDRRYPQARFLDPRARLHGR